MYGEGLEREETVPYLISDALQCQFYDESQNSSSNKLIYLRAMNTLFSEDSYDLYFIMWSRGMDRRFEKILDYSESYLEMNLVYDVAHNIAKLENVDGFLIGSSSLDPFEFYNISKNLQ